MYSKLLSIFALLALVGCANVQQRPDETSCNELTVTSTECSKSSFISLKTDGQAEDPTIAFIEFNDDGLPYDQSNIDSVLTRIEGLNSKNNKSLLMVVFIHGWHHNAAQTDNNVIEFKKFLQSLHKEEQTLDVGKPRTVVGLYMGWQGKASDTKVISLFSYRRKKELGLQTGQKSVTDVLRKLSTIRASDRDNRLILVGHSFGGGVLYSAVKDDLLERLNSNNKQSVKLFGDLVILMNPAVEAERFVSVHKTLNQTFPECTPLTMVSFTSEADTALSDEFPRGMKMFYSDKLKGDASDVLQTTAYGIYHPFSKYELRLDPNTEILGVLSKEVFNAAVPSWEAFRAAQSSFDLGALKLSHNTNGSRPSAWEPVLNVFVDKSLIQGHNEIWDPNFMYFLRGLIGMEFAKSRQCN